MAKNAKLLRQVTKEIVERRVSTGLTGRMAGPRAPKELVGIAKGNSAGAGVRYMNATDPDDNLMEFHPSKRELAISRGKRRKRMRRR